LPQKALLPLTLVLRHSIVPYRTLGAFFLAMLVWAFVASYRSAKWGAFESALLVSAVYSLQIFLGLWYQVGLSDGVIWQRAFGKRRVSIAIRDISSVGQETSDAKTLATMNRPFRRITIRGSTAGESSSVDVSTKHFVAADIRRLMHIIQESRPDLSLPRQWL
jgi:hypothetical protein